MNWQLNKCGISRGIRVDLPGRESGISLIEVMVTVVIVSFGLLGIAGMLFSSVSAGQVSMQRSIASMLANEMADRIRSNYLAIQAGAFDTVQASDYAGTAACTTTCMTGQCSPSDQAVLDVCLWKKQIIKQLPNASGSISNAGNLKCQQQGVPCAFVVAVTWNEKVYRTSGTAGQAYQISPNTYALMVQP